MERHNKLFSDVDLFLDLRNQNVTLPMITCYSFFKNKTCLCLCFTSGIRMICSSNIHMNRMASSLKGEITGKKNISPEM